MAKKSGKTSTKRTTVKTAVKDTVTQKLPTNQPAKPRSGPRRLKQPKYKSLRIQKRIRHPVKLPSVWRLSKKATETLWQHKRLFIGMTLVYGLLNAIFAQGISGGTDVSSLKQTLDQASSGQLHALASGFSVFVTLVGSSGNTTSATGGAYQLFLGLIASLAIIWSLRQVLAGSKVRIRDAYYRGMYPLVPFILVLCAVGLQLLPLLIGAGIYGLVISHGIAVLFVEKLAWALFYALTALLSLYMISSSLFAVYIVTLPDMTPMKALRSARELVRYRRWTVLRKVLCLPIILLFVAAIVMLPIILWLTPLAQWIFFLLTMFGLLGVHSYMYTLYRELLNE